ncbi:MAG: hypothetical protein RR838_13540, partial [Clostridium sp.]
VTQVGMWIVILVSLIVIVFTVIATYKIKKQKSLLGVITTVSIIIPFVINSILFITNNLGYGIVESLPIAFVGRGTVSLLINSGLIGFMLSVFRTGYIYSDSSSVFKKDTYFFNRS